MSKAKKPKHLFRAMSAKEVEEFWTRLHDADEKAEAVIKRSLTGDGQGIRWFAQQEFLLGMERAQTFRQARHYLVEILARKK